MDIVGFNRAAWNRQVEQGNPWTVPVGPDLIAEARAGRWSVVLTPERAVPREWFGQLAGADVLALASAGGQQACVLAAAGATVTLFDLSPAQLQRDRDVAARDGLALRIEEGDMRDLSRFADAAFDLVFHPVSNLFVPDPRPVWRECHRVLRRGGRLLAGFCNPALFLVDADAFDRGDRTLRWRLPYADVDALGADAIEAKRAEGAPLEWSHSLEAQLGGQIEAGFRLAALYEDGWPGAALGEWMRPFLATLAVKD